MRNKFKPKFVPFSVTGDGTSLWCEKEKSKRTFEVTSMKLNNLCGGEEPYELQLFGPDHEWFHYTDRRIQKEVEKNMLPLMKELYPKAKITGIEWSEQGMQPDKGWSFDICTKRAS